MEDSLNRTLARYREVETFQALQIVVKEFSGIRRKLSKAPEGYISCKIWVLSNYSTQFISSALGPALADKGIWADVQDAGYDQWETALVDQDHPAVASGSDFILLLLSSTGLAFRSDATSNVVADRIVSAIRAGLAKSSAKIIVTLPEPLEDEKSSFSWAYDWRMELIHRLKSRLHENEVVLVDLEPLIRNIGSKNWHAERYYVTSNLPFHPNCTYDMVEHLSRVVRSSMIRPCKLVVTDLDGTLWGGVVGDDGWQSVRLDARSDGYGFLRMQRFLKNLRTNGTVLAIASKNTSDVALEVFAKRPEMLLKESDFAAIEINWERKSDNIRRILQNLNMTTSQVVFLDDNPGERFEVATSLPEIYVPELPKDPGERISMLLDSGLFDMHSVGREDKLRTRYYEQERTRKKKLESVGDYGTFLRGLELKLFPMAIEDNRDRVVKLINKTNQFNLTARRHGWSDIVEIVGNGGIGICFRLEDRFGDYGIISVLLASAERDKTLRIDTWVMSCRVMGRTVERAIFGYVLRQCRELGIARILGEYVPTAKNAPVASLFPSLGFKDAGGNSRFCELNASLGLETIDYPYVSIVGTS